MKEWASTTSWQSQRSPPQSSADHSPPTSHHSHTGPSCGLQAARLAKRWQVSRKAPARQGRHLQGGTPGFLRDSSAAEKNSILARVQGCLQRAATPLAADKDGAEASSPAPASHSPMRPYHVFAVSGVVEGYHHAFGYATIPRWTRELLFPPTSTTWWTRSCPATSVPRRASSPGRLPPPAQHISLGRPSSLTALECHPFTRRALRPYKVGDGATRPVSGTWLLAMAFPIVWQPQGMTGCRSTTSRYTLAEDR
ncbi:hypothetical protein GCWB2_23920 (plasmid) [Gordonia rubripertincta]|nr:hypothetical protein GCWB2_23920 [Gordonia rubripertincta]